MHLEYCFSEGEGGVQRGTFVRTVQVRLFDKSIIQSNWFRSGKLCGKGIRSYPDTACASIDITFVLVLNVRIRSATTILITTG